MKRLRIDNLRQLRRFSLRLLTEIMQNEDANLERYKVLNQYINTIGKQFQIEQTIKVTENPQDREMTEEELADALDRLKRILE